MWVVVAAAAAAPPQTAAIIAGARETEWPSAVALGAGGLTICTGNLVTPRLVLTAAHCQADLPFELIVQFGAAYVGVDARDPDHTLALADAAVHPDYRELSGRFLGENDVGVLVLAEDAPAEVTPIPFRTRPLERPTTVGETVLSVGYGLTETGGSGVKHSAPLTVSDVDPMFLLSDSADNENRANVCSGDSGGPQFHVDEGGRVEQWAVHSWADVDCAFSSGSTRVDNDTVLPWLLDQLEAVHGTSDFCEIAGRYDDDVCDGDCPALDPVCLRPFAGIPRAEARGGCDAAHGTGGALAGLLAALGLRRRR